MPDPKVCILKNHYHGCFICLNFVREIFFVRELHTVKYFIIGRVISQGKPREIVFIVKVISRGLPREIIISHLDI